MNITIINNIIKLVNKLFPDGDAKLKVLLALEEGKNKLKQPLTISILSISVYYVWVGKSVFYRLNQIVYFNTIEFWIDVLIMAMVFSFQLGIPFKDFVKALTDSVNNFIADRKNRKK